MAKFILLCVVIFVSVLVLVPPLVERLNRSPRVMLEPEDLTGPWPFRASSIEISCCVGGRIGVVDETGQWFAWRPGDRHFDRFPITALGAEGTSVESFREAERAALALAREHWPELNPR